MPEAVLSPHRTSMILNGVEMLEGLAEDEDSVEFGDFELLTERRGTTGDLVVFGTGARGSEITVKYLPTSEVAKMLMVQLKRTLTDGTVTVYNGSITNTDTGVSAVLNGGVVKGPPLWWTFGMGNVNNMEFVFTFFEIIPDFEGANYASGGGGGGGLPGGTPGAGALPPGIPI